MEKFRVGSWYVDPNHSLLISDLGHEIRIEPLNMALLCYFANSPSVPVTKEILITDIWHDKVVTDHAVYKTINQLRKYLASDGDQQKYIKTVPKKGYALVAPVNKIEEKNISELTNQSTNYLKTWFYKKPVFHTLLAITIIGFLIWYIGLNSWWHKNQQPDYSHISVINQIDGILDEAIPSPNEEWLLVTSYGNSSINNRDIYLLNLENQTRFKLTDGDYDYSKISWSVLGDKLIASKRPTSAFITDHCDLVILHLKEDFSAITEEAYVTKCSPLGSSAAYDDDKDIIYYNYSKSTVVPSSTYSLSLDTGEIELLTNPGTAVWGDWSIRLSPSRDKLLYMRVYEEDNDIYIYDLAEKEEHFIFKYVSYIDQLSWSSDGNNLIYQPSKNQVALYSLEHGYSKVLITKDNAIISSYNGAKSDHIYTISRDNDSEIANIELKEPSNPEVRHSSKAMELAAVYANNSDQFVFVSKRSGHWQLWLSRAGSLKKVTDNTSESVIYTPKWSPNDNTVTYSMAGEIYIVDMESFEGTKIFSDKNSYVQIPFWAPDGESIYFTKIVKETNQIFKLHLKSKKLQQVTSNGGYAGSVSQDNNYMFLVKDDHHGLWRLDMRNLEEIKVNAIASIDDFHNIQINQNGLYFTHYSNRENVLYYVDLATLKTERVAGYEANTTSSFSINKDETELLTIIDNISNATLSVYKP